MSFYPITAAPLLHDLFIRNKFNVLSFTVSIVRSELPAHLTADVGFRAAERRVLTGIHERFIYFGGFCVECGGLAVGFCLIVKFILIFFEVKLSREFGNFFEILFFG